MFADYLLHACIEIGAGSTLACTSSIVSTYMQKYIFTYHNDNVYYYECCMY